MAFAMPTTFRRWLGAEPETKAAPVSGVTAPEPWLYELLSFGASASGPAVTPMTAMRVPAVKAAFELIASTVATLPCKVFADVAAGGKEPDPDHPAYPLVHADANPWTSAGKLREQLTQDALLWGNGFALANRVNGRVIELNRLAPGAVAIELDPLTGEPRYRVKLTERDRFAIYGVGEVLHIPAPVSYDGVSGVAPISLAREAIALALTLEIHAARLFGNGARPGGILKFPGKLGADVAQRIKASWQGAFGGENTGKTAVLEEGADFQPVALNSVDAQFAEMRTFQIYEIARAFRVPPHMIFEMGRATWSNSEELNRHFLTYSLLPWLKAWEAAYRRVLLPADARDGVAIKFVTDALLSATTAQRASAYAQFRSAGVMTANEIRALENLPARPDGDSLASPLTTAGSEAPANV
jgi:HK97 family phage portal protein